MKLFKHVLCLVLTISYSSMIAMKALKIKQDKIATESLESARTASEGSDALSQAMNNLRKSMSGKIHGEEGKALLKKLDELANTYLNITRLSASEKYQQFVPFKIKMDGVLMEVQGKVNTLSVDQALRKASNAALEGYIGFLPEVMKKRRPLLGHTQAEKDFYIKNILPKDHPWTALLKDGINIKTIADGWVKHVEDEKLGIDIWIKKNGIARSAAKMVIEKILEKEKLDLIKFPEEYIIFIDKNNHTIVRPKTANDIIPDMDIYLVSKNIEDGEMPINKSQAEQMDTLLKMFDRFDAGYENIRIDPRGNLYLIDAEPKGDSYIIGLPNFCYRYKFNDEAKKYLNQALEKLDPMLEKIK